MSKTIRTLATALLLAALALPGFAADGKVNINTASAQQLQMLPGVGPSLADRIVEYRKANGDFKSIEQLALVRGIGEKKCEALKPYLGLSGETTLAAKVHSPRPSGATRAARPSAKPAN